jgi:hypothetical protein
MRERLEITMQPLVIKTNTAVNRIPSFFIEILSFPVTSSNTPHWIGSPQYQAH